MSSLRSSRGVLLAAAVLAVSLCAAPYSRADIVQSSASLPPATGSYTAGTICVHLGVMSGGVCVVGPSLHGFTGTTSTFGNSGQSIDSSISFGADIYTNNNGVPGTFLGRFSASGPIGILYAGRASDEQTGTFTSSLTELDLTGGFSGHTLEVILGPQTSSGPTTVMPSGSEFVVSSFFDVFAELSVDGGLFVAGPQRTFVLTPEPGSASLLILGLVGVAGELRRRARAVISR